MAQHNTFFLSYSSGGQKSKIGQQDCIISVALDGNPCPCLFKLQTPCAFLGSWPLLLYLQNNFKSLSLSSVASVITFCLTLILDNLGKSSHLKVFRHTCNIPFAVCGIRITGSGHQDINIFRCFRFIYWWGRIWWMNEQEILEIQLESYGQLFRDMIISDWCIRQKNKFSICNWWNTELTRTSLVELVVFILSHSNIYWMCTMW